LGAVVDIGLLVSAGVNTQGVFSQTGAGAGRKAYSKEFEREADYMSLYFMVRAGFDTTKAADVQRKIGIAKPGTLYSNYASTHPSSPERAANLEAALQEVAGKVVRQEPLLPSALAENQQNPSPVLSAEHTQITLQQHRKAEQERRASTAEVALKPVVPERKLEPVRRAALLTHVKGKTVTVPPTVSQVEYNDDGNGRGTSRIIHPGNRIVEGEFQILPWDRAFDNQAQARLIDLGQLVAPQNSQAKGFASYSSSDGTVIECAFSVSSSSRIDRGQCFDNRDNVYQISY
jgi:hypothetical protein